MRATIDVAHSSGTEGRQHDEKQREGQQQGQAWVEKSTPHIGPVLPVRYQTGQQTPEIVDAMSITGIAVIDIDCICLGL
jgi:hypothetical protein